MSIFKKSNEHQFLKVTQPEEIQTILKNLQENQTEIAIYSEKNKFFGQITEIKSAQTFNAVFEDCLTPDTLTKSKRIDFEFRIENEIYKTNLHLISSKKEGSTYVYSFGFPDSIELDPFYKFYRITPSLNHSLAVTFIVVSKIKPLGVTQQFRIRDISIEGFSFVVPNIIVPFYPGFILKGIAITGIDNDSIVCDARVRNYDRNICTISYQNLSDQNKETINRYIISAYYQQKKMHESKALELETSPPIQETFGSTGSTGSAGLTGTAGTVETANRKGVAEPKSEEKRSNHRLLIIDNHPDQCLLNLEKIHRVKTTSFDSFDLFYKTIFPEVILFNPGYIKGYEILQRLVDLNKERQIPIIIIFRQLSPAFREQLSHSFQFAEYLSIPFKEDEFNDVLERILQSADSGND